MAEIEVLVRGFFSLNAILRLVFFLCFLFRLNFSSFFPQPLFSFPPQSSSDCRRISHCQLLVQHFIEGDGKSVCLRAGFHYALGKFMSQNLIQISKTIHSSKQAAM